jgi:hypothetical protein
MPAISPCFFGFDYQQVANTLAFVQKINVPARYYDKKAEGTFLKLLACRRRYESSRVFLIAC